MRGPKPRLKPPPYRVLDEVYDARSLIYGRVSRIDLERGTITFRAAHNGNSRTVYWEYLRKKTSRPMRRISFSRRQEIAFAARRRPRPTGYWSLPYQVRARVHAIAEKSNLTHQQVIREMGL